MLGSIHYKKDKSIIRICTTFTIEKPHPLMTDEIYVITEVEFVNLERFDKADFTVWNDFTTFDMDYVDRFSCYLKKLKFIELYNGRI